MPTDPKLSCPRCGKRLKEVLAKAAPDLTYQCLDCDGIDPLKTKEVSDWLNSELAKSGDKFPKK